MNLLLDTHTFLWFVAGDTSLSDVARLLIEDPDNLKHLSVVSIWEMAIKYSRGRLSFTDPFQQFISEQLQLNDIGVLDVKKEHAYYVHDMPFHHKDPFDRLLIAQSIVEDMPLVGKDLEFDAYPIHRLW